MHTQSSMIYIHKQQKKYSPARHPRYHPYVEVPHASLTHQEIALVSQLRILVLRMSLAFLPATVSTLAHVLWAVQHISLQGLYSPTPGNVGTPKKQSSKLLDLSLAPITAPAKKVMFPYNSKAPRSMRTIGTGFPPLESGSGVTESHTSCGHGSSGCNI